MENVENHRINVEINNKFHNNSIFYIMYLQARCILFNFGGFRNNVAIEKNIDYII